MFLHAANLTDFSPSTPSTAQHIAFAVLGVAHTSWSELSASTSAHTTHQKQDEAAAAMGSLIESVLSDRKKKALKTEVFKAF